MHTNITAKTFGYLSILCVVLYALLLAIQHNHHLTTVTHIFIDILTTCTTLQTIFANHPPSQHNHLLKNRQYTIFLILFL